MDIVDEVNKALKEGFGVPSYLVDAANEIERLRKALREILTHETDYEPYDCIEIARAALKESK